MSMSSVCCRPVSSDMVIAGTEFGSSLGIHLFWSPGAHSSWNRARWQNHRGQSLAGIGLFSGSPCERPKDTTHLQKLFWSWVLSPFVDEYLLMSPVVGRIVRSAYSLGRSVVECILLGGFWWVTDTMVFVAAGFSECHFCPDDLFNITGACLSCDRVMVE
jgi:hypothetical protein